jgi:aerobic carbon-monoxide dehydrogenase large subunit
MKFGKSQLRQNDPEILRGVAIFASDVCSADMLSAAVFRSAVAHARILSINTNAAKAIPGVVAVLLAADLGTAQVKLPSFGQFPKSIIDQWHPVIRDASQLTLAVDKVRYVGEPIALIVANSRAIAEDALDALQIEVETLPATTDADAALQPGAPKLFDEHPDNIALDLHVRLGAVDQAFSNAAHIICDEFYIQRHSGLPLEGRSILAIPNGKEGLTVWTSHQLPHYHRALICKVLDLPEFSVEMKQANIGGGFGLKAGLYPEDILIPFAAHRLGRPIKWVEDKREQTIASSHSREQKFSAEMAFDGKGHILGIRYHARIDAGAYLTFPVTLPYIGIGHFLGPYRMPTLDARVQSVLTNKTTSAPYRGAGRPEAVFVLNRLIDRAATNLGMDALDLRRLNMITPGEMPVRPGLLYRDGNPMQLDSGDYPSALERVVDKIDYVNFRSQQKRELARNRFLGIGFSCNVESSGLGPFESARVRIDATGTVALHLGVSDTGQGYKTSLAQVCADVLGIEPDRIKVLTGDTTNVPYSRGTYHSRVAVTAGNAVKAAAEKIKVKLQQIASEELEASTDDLELADGHVGIVGSDRRISFERCARLASPSAALPRGRQPGLDEVAYFEASVATWGNAVHAAVVEVDPETGGVSIKRYVALHDCGRMINPLLVRGQILGGIVAGIGGSLLEELAYDAEGNPVTTTLQDYLLPRITDIPEIEILHMETPSPLNPLGVKGAGEGGTVSPPAALAAAVEDALARFGARLNATPLSPRAILQALREAQGT